MDNAQTKIKSFFLSPAPALEIRGKILRNILALAFLAFLGASCQTHTDNLNCDLTGYKAQPGLSATVAEDVLTVVWDGDENNEVRLQFAIEDSVPTIRELAVKKGEGQWAVLATNATPEVRVVSGLRRVTQQQMEPLEELGVPMTEKTIDKIKWDAFWDAPLYLEDKPALTHQSSIPPAKPFAGQPGMPRNPDEVHRATATYHATGCTVRTNGARLEITFPGVDLGIFSGYLQYDVFKGSNLIRQMAVAKTSGPSVAFKYDAGLKGLPITQQSQMAWRDLHKQWQGQRVGDIAQNGSINIVKGSNRLISAELQGGSIAAFPPPHSFYWARESEQVLGYGWYRKDGDKDFSFGIRQAELEQDPQYYHNFALYNARPGKWERMPMFMYISPGPGQGATEGALAFTHVDHFKPLPGYKVMGTHYHVDLVKRLKALGGFDHKLNDIETMKAVGVDIFGDVDGPRGPGRHDKGELFLNDLAEYYAAAKSQSDSTFLVFPEDEESTSGRGPFLGGHYDMLFSKPTYWRPARKPGQPLVEMHPKYGKVYNLGSPMDLMHMAERENVLVSMPHPRAKRSTGYPDSIKDTPHFLHKNYFGLGYRWGMGIDASEKRLGEYRFLTLWNETNNWMAARGLSPKFALAISETRSDHGDRGKPPIDDTYGMSPVNYIKIDKVPTVDDMSSIINALKAGNYFVTSGEVLIPSFSVEGTGSKRTMVAEVEWTFPLDFVELVWGDGEKTGRQIIPTTDLPPFGKKRFEIPFDARGKKWIRFAAWDIASDGALLQPVDLANAGDKP